MLLRYIEVKACFMRVNVTITPNSKMTSTLSCHLRVPLIRGNEDEMMRKRREAKPLLLENQTHKRRDRAQELRSAKRQGVLAKRRKYDLGEASAASLQGESWPGHQLEMVIHGVRESHISQVLSPLVELRKLLSLEDPPVEEVVERAGLGPKLIELLGSRNDEVQIEASWCITNIASSWTRHTEKILGATPQLISFLSAPNPALQEQAMWALGNIAGDSADFREMLHKNGALLPIFRLLQQPPTIEIARTAAWAMSNLARGGKTPGKPFLSVAPSIIAALRGDYMTGAPRDESLRVEAAWILAFLTAKENETVTELMRHGVVPALVEALVGSGGEDPLCTPALRALGNMVSGAEEWADAVMLHKQFLPCLDAVLKSTNKAQRAIVKEAAWVVSNVAAGRPEHCQALVAQGSTSSLLTLLVSDQLDLQQEAAHGIWNIVSCKHELLVQAAANDEVVKAFVNLLRSHSPPVVRCALSFLHILCQNVDRGPRIVEAAGGLEAIEDVHYSGQTDPGLQEAAGSMIDKFFGEDGYNSSDEDDEDDKDDHEGSGSCNFMRGAFDQSQSQPTEQQMPAASLGRGAHLTRPAWMSQNP